MDGTLESCWRIDEVRGTPRLQFRPWLDVGIQHAFWGCPKNDLGGPGEAANLFGLNQGPLVSLDQVHGALVHEVADISENHQVQGDALILRGDRDSARGALVRTADCVPLLIRMGRDFALIHAGWRGLVAGVIPQALRALGATDGSGVECLIGPAAGGERYEIGPDVVAQLPATAALVRGAQSNRVGLEMALSARNQVLGTCPQAHVWVAGICTIRTDTWYSYRRNPANPGRNQAIIYLG